MPKEAAKEKKYVWEEHEELAEYITLFSRKLELANPEWLDKWDPETLKKLSTSVKEVERIVIAQEKIVLKIIGENRKEEVTIRDVLPELKVEHEERLANVEKQEVFICKNINYNLRKLLETLREQLVCFEEDRKDVKRESKGKKVESAKRERIALRPKLLALIRTERRFVEEINHLLDLFMKELKEQNFVKTEETRELLPRFNIVPPGKSFGQWNLGGKSGILTTAILVKDNIDSIFVTHRAKADIEWFKRKALSKSWTEVEGIKLGDALFAKQGIALCISKGIGMSWRNAIIATSSAKIKAALKIMRKWPGKS